MEEAVTPKYPGVVVEIAMTWAATGRTGLRHCSKLGKTESLAFSARPDKRTSKDLFMFYGEMERTRPELLKRGHGDPYQQLKVDLRGYITF
jgi:hypothetical protein